MATADRGVFLKKLILFCLFFLCWGGLPASADSPDLQPVTAADLHSLWPDKANWVGQTVIFFGTKISHDVGYLLIFSQPTVDIAGIDQLAFSQTLINKKYVITGLFTQKAKSSYYWKLVGDESTDIVWVKDTSANSAADQPFAFAAEIAAENSSLLQAAAFAKTPVWVNINHLNPVDLSAKVTHLQPVTVVSVLSAGPFSENYLVTLTTDDGTAILWKTGLHTNTPVYSNQQFVALFQQCFFLKDPYAAHPKWTDATWTALKARTVSLGMEKDMVQLSWGDPENIQKLGTKELWDYPGHHQIYFTKDLVSKIMVHNPNYSASPTANSNSQHNHSTEEYISVPMVIAQ